MAVKFEFCLTDDDTARLFAIRANEGENSLSANEFAKVLLVRELHHLHPLVTQYDESGNPIN